MGGRGRGKGQECRTNERQGDGSTRLAFDGWVSISDGYISSRFFHPKKFAHHHPPGRLLRSWREKAMREFFLQRKKMVVSGCSTLLFFFFILLLPMIRVWIGY